MIAARLSGVPGIVYLPDLRPGWAVRFLSRLATAVAVSFDDVVPHIHAQQVVVTELPGAAGAPHLVPRSGSRGARPPDHEPVVLVLGGSRGAKTINEAILADLPRLLEGAIVIHASGAQHYAVLERRRRTLPENVQARYHLHPYLDKELAPSMAAANLVVAPPVLRSSASFPPSGCRACLYPTLTPEPIST